MASVLDAVKLQSPFPGLFVFIAESKSSRFTMTATKPTPVKPSVPIDVLNEIDIRVGTIDFVEEVKGSDKLVKLIVNFGDHKRSILAGMRKERQNPKEVEGRQALFIINLEPKRMFGELSEGMLFDIGYADGITPVLAVPERPVPNGTRAG